MSKYIFQLSNGDQAQTEVEAIDDDDALSIAMTALSNFACSKFPPPEHIEIRIRNSREQDVATVHFSCVIEMAEPPNPPAAAMN